MKEQIIEHPLRKISLPEVPAEVVIERVLISRRLNQELKEVIDKKRQELMLHESV
jgi:hypothetical protein